MKVINIDLFYFIYLFLLVEAFAAPSSSAFFVSSSSSLEIIRWKIEVEFEEMKK